MTIYINPYWFGFIVGVISTLTLEIVIGFRISKKNKK